MITILVLVLAIIELGVLAFGLYDYFFRKDSVLKKLANSIGGELPPDDDED